MIFSFEKTSFLMIIYTVFLFDTISAQYSFQNYPPPDYKTYDDWKVFDRISKKGKYDCTLTISDFFNNNDDLTIQLTWLEENVDIGEIRLFKNSNQIQQIKEPGSFSSITMSGTLAIVSDINGDGFKDVKLIHQGTGNGIMGMLVKVIYFFQKEDESFTKISFNDMMFEQNRLERDVDNDGSHEIITMNLKHVNDHNYWVFNVFEYCNGGLKNANEKENYPILIQYKHKRNYMITDHMDRSQMKAYELTLPDKYHAE